MLSRRPRLSCSVEYFARTSPSAMIPPLSPALAEIVQQYRTDNDIAHLIERATALAAHSDPDALMSAAAPYEDIPEVVGPLYERVLEAQPNNSRALVGLANAYWLSGRGPDIVGALATRALAADPDKSRRMASMGARRVAATRAHGAVARGCGALCRTTTWPGRVLADNAVAVAGAEHDPVALAVAIDTYTELRGRADEHRPGGRAGRSFAHSQELEALGLGDATRHSGDLFARLGAQRRNGIEQHFYVVWFSDKWGATLGDHFAPLGRDVAREKHCRAGKVRLQSRSQVIQHVASHVGHPQVKHQNIDVARPQQIVRGFPARSGQRVVAGSLKSRRHGGANGGLIVHDKHA